MALTILQQPQSLTFVGNIPELIVQTDGLGMTVNITKGGTLILAEYYTADDQGRSRVLLRDFLDEYLHLDLPGEDELYEQTRSIAAFAVEIISGESTEDITFTAIKGGSSTLNLDCATFLKESWLTWQPQIKKVKDVQPEWLSFFTQQAAVVKIRGHFSGGASETNTLHSLATGKHYTMNMTYSDLRGEFVNQPVYIDVWVENDGGEAFTSYVQRYVLTDEFFEFDDFFLFKNSVGGIDTIRLTGERESTNPIEIDTALFDDEYERDYQVTPRLAFEKNTGFFRSRAELLWAMDFFQSKEKYYLIEEAISEIRLLNPDYSAPEHVLTSLDFKFSYTRQSLYLSLFKKKSPLIDPIIIAPGDDDYYLPPDIGIFPQQADPSGLLFPVQKPGTPGWFFITWENMLADILENLPAADHNELAGLQGGDSEQEEYYHLTEEERQKVQDLQDPAPVDGVFITGSVEFNSPIDVDLDGWAWIIAGVTYPGGNQNITPILGTPANYNRVDIAVGKNDGSIEWISGSEGSEQIVDPLIPQGTILLARILRLPSGSNINEVSPEDLSDFVSKSVTGTQTLQSQLAVLPLAGSFRDAVYPNANGRLSKIRADFFLTYSSVEGTGNWSKLASINTASPQRKYFLSLEFAGISGNYLKGSVWCQFTLDTGGNLIVNDLQVFGDIDTTRLKLVKISSELFELFVSHEGVSSFFKFRPEFSFGPSGTYTFYHQGTRTALPAGDQYEFEQYGDLSDMAAAITALEDWLLDLEGEVDDHEVRIDELETRDYLEDITAGSNVTIDKTDPKNPIINATGGGGGSGQAYINDLDTWPTLKFDKNYRYVHEVNGPIEISAEFVTPLAAVGNFCKLYVKADGVNIPMLTGDFEVVWDNYVNTAGFWNRFYAEYSPEGKVILQIENAHQGIANTGSGTTDIQVEFSQNNVITQVISTTTEISILSLDAEIGNRTILYVQADGVNKPFWDSNNVVVTYDNYLNQSGTWNRIILEWGADNKAIVQIINT